MKVNRGFIISFFLILLLAPEFSTGFSVASDASVQSTAPIQTISEGTTTTDTIELQNNNGNGFYYLNLPSSGIYNITVTVEGSNSASVTEQIIGLVNVTDSTLGSYQLPYSIFYNYGQSSSSKSLSGFFTLPAVFPTKQLGLTLTINSQATQSVVKITIINTTNSGLAVSSKIPLFQQTTSNFFKLDTTSLGITTPGFYNMSASWNLTSSNSNNNIRSYGYLSLNQNFNNFYTFTSTYLYSNYLATNTITTNFIIYIDPTINNIVQLSGYGSYSSCSSNCNTNDLGASLSVTLNSAQEISGNVLNSGDTLTVNQNKIIQLNVNSGNFYSLNAGWSNGTSNSVIGSPKFSSQLYMPGTNGANSYYYMNNFNTFEFYYGKTNLSYGNLEYTPNINGLVTPQEGLNTIQGFTTYNNSYFSYYNSNFNLGSAQISFTSTNNQTTGLYIKVNPAYGSSLTFSLTKITPETLPLNTTITLDPTNPDASAKVYQVATAQNDIIEYSSVMQLKYESNTNSGSASFGMSSTISGTGLGLFNSNYNYANTTKPYQPFIFTTEAGTTYLILTSSINGYLSTNSFTPNIQTFLSYINSKSITYSFIKTRVAQFPNDYSNIFHTASTSIFTLPVTAGTSYTFKLGGDPFAQSSAYFILLDQNGKLMSPNGFQELVGYSANGLSYSINYKPDKSQTLYLVIFGTGVVSMHVHVTPNIGGSTPGFEALITFFGLLALVPVYLHKKKKQT